MKNFVQAGSALTIPASADVASGGVVVAGSIIGVAGGSALTGKDVVVHTTGVFELSKAAGAITLGAIVYWDSTPGNVTTTATDNVKIGVAVAAAGSGDATVRVRLNGSF